MNFGSPDLEKALPKLKSGRLKPVAIRSYNEQTQNVDKFDQYLNLYAYQQSFFMEEISCSSSFENG
jgi:hypothetical protein